MPKQAIVGDIFNNIPKQDYLGILKENNSPKSVVDFLELTKEDVASATGINKASIRYDERIPSELEHCLQEIGMICALVAEHFKGDLKKTALWFRIKNPALGNISPRDMIRNGRYIKLQRLIQNFRVGNYP